MTIEFKLTEDQQKASDTFFRFLLSDATTFVLSGGAGVGKTFLMSHICKRVMNDYADACKLMGVKEAYDTLAFTATTNKAAEVLEQSINKPVQTIHSYMGLKVKDNYKTGKTDIEKTNNYKQRYRCIVFIDESSMIDMEMYKLILETFVDSKIVFVGDHAQMSPVGEEVSQVYAHIQPENFVFLHQPVRNAGSPALVDLCNQLRHTVETGEFFPIDAVPGSIEYLDNQTMPARLGEVFKDDMDPSARILCYTNSRAKEYNSFIREIRGLPASQFQPGDHLVVGSNYALGKNVLNVERELIVEEVGTSLINAGFHTYSPDQKPIMIREATVRPLSCSVPFQIKIADEPERVQYVLKQIAKQKNWVDYFNLKGLCADLRDKAACTVYKSQGSTYEQVFIDLGNIGTSFDPKQVARMLFVAASRATTNVWLYGHLPGKYHRSLAA